MTPQEAGTFVDTVRAAYQRAVVSSLSLLPQVLQTAQQVSVRGAISSYGPIIDKWAGQERSTALGGGLKEDGTLYTVAEWQAMGNTILQELSETLKDYDSSTATWILTQTARQTGEDIERKAESLGGASLLGGAIAVAGGILLYSMLNKRR